MQTMLCAELYGVIPKTARPAATNSGSRKGFRTCIGHRTTDTPQLYLHVRRKASGNRLLLSRSAKSSSPGEFSTRACSCRTVCLPAAWFRTVPNFSGHGWRGMPGPGASASRCCPPWQRTLASRSGRCSGTWPNSCLAVSSALASAGTTSPTSTSFSGTQFWLPLVCLLLGGNNWNSRHTAYKKKGLFWVELWRARSSRSNPLIQKDLPAHSQREGRQIWRPVARQGCRPALVRHICRPGKMILRREMNCRQNRRG